MADQNFYALLRNRYQPHLDKPCLTTPDRMELSYRDLDTLSARMAATLRDQGAQPGDRVMVQVEKSPENVALYFGSLRAGLVYVPLNTAYTPNEIEYFLTDAKPTLFICRPEMEETLKPIAKTAGVSSVLTLGTVGDGSLSEWSGRHVKEITKRDVDDLASILYTSGTTGRSKGAMLTHGNLSSNAVALHRLWGFQPGDVLLHALPVFHIHGLFVALHTAMLNGSEILFQPNFNVNQVRKQMRQATIIMGVPTFYSRLLAEPDFGQEDCRHMRLFISGSAPLTTQVWKVFKVRTGHEILERYGMSEAGMIASNPLDGTRTPGTVGFPLPDVDVRITDDDGAVLPSGETGSVEVKGPNVFAGYWGKPEKTAAEFRDGWFVTGDLGALDAEDRLTLSGRSKDLMIAGGYNIYPKEIELVLDSVPGVKESAVIGVPHPDMGEGVIAVLVPERFQAKWEPVRVKKTRQNKKLESFRNSEKIETAPDDRAPDAPPVSEEAIAAALQTLARFKRPRRIYWLEALPRNAMGKVQKQALREMYQDTFMD